MTAAELRERVAREVWIGTAYPQKRDHPDTERIWRDMPRDDVRVVEAYTTADRVLRSFAPPATDEARERLRKWLEGFDTDAWLNDFKALIA